MDNLIASLVAITRTTAEQAESMSYEQLAAFVEEREFLLMEFWKRDAELSEGAQKRKQYQHEISQVLQWDAAIVRRMEALQAEASDHLEKLNDFQKQKSAFDSDYAADSYFFDKRK